MKKRKGLYIATAAIVAAIAGTLVMANGGVKLQVQPLTAESTTSSIVFQNFSGQNICTTSLSNGGTIRTYGETAASNGDLYLRTNKGVFFEYVANGVSNDTLTINSTSRSVARFQKINSIKLNYNGGSGTVLIYSSANGSTWTSATASDNTTISLVSNAKYVYIFGDTSYCNRYISKVTLSYTCDPNPGAPTLSSISLSGQTTSFTVGDTFEFGGTVTAHYSDSSSSDVTSSATFSGYNMSTAGEQTVTVSYTESGTTKTADYTIEVEDDTPSAGLSGTYTKQYTYSAITYDLSIDFDNLVYTCVSNNETKTMHFTYSVDGTTLTFTKNKLGSDSSEDDFGRCRLFYDSSETTNTATIVSDSSISVALSYSFGGKRTHTETFAK